MTMLSPFGERSLTVVAAGYDDLRHAESAASQLLQETPELEGEVTIVRPADPLVDRKLEPENQGIWRTLIRSHIVFGLAGGAAGVAVALLATALWPAAALSPFYTALFVGVLGAFFGGLFAGLLTLRPDHSYVIEKVHEFLARGQWAVVARPLNEACSKAAYASLMRSGSAAVRSF